MGRPPAYLAAATTRRGSEPTSYFAGTQTLASFECEQETLILGAHLGVRNPRVIVAVTVANVMVLDLTKQLVLHGVKRPN